MQKNIAIVKDLFHRAHDRIRGTSARQSGEILASADELNGILERIEPHFLLLGNLFQEAQGATGRFIREVVHAAETIRGGKGQTGLTGIKDLARGCVDRLDAHRREIARSVERFDQVIRDLALLPRACEKADRVSLLLRVIALNIGIESQGLGGERDVFKAFVEEVYVLSGHMKTVSEGLCRDSGRLRKKHTRTMRDVEHDVYKLDLLVREARNDVDVSSIHVHSLMETALDSMETVRDTMRRIEKKAGDIVVSLQFHDIIRQKVEHMVSALAEAAKLMDPTYLNCPNRKNKDRVRSILMVQTAQIDEVRKEIQDAHHSISQALTGIDDDVGEIYRHISRYGTQKTGTEDPFHALMASMGSLETIRTQALELGGRVHRYMDDASWAASALTGHMDAVEQIRLDLHRKALNAIVKAAHLGERGQGIEVFAQEVNKASLETRIFAEEVAAVVGDVCSKTKELHRGGLNGDGHAVDRGFTRGLASLAEAYETFERHIEGMTGHFEGIEDVLARGRESLSFLEDFSRAMDTVRTAIQLTAEQIIPVPSTGGNETGESAGEHRYTMASERRVHDRILGFEDADTIEYTFTLKPEEPQDVEHHEDHKEKTPSGESFGDNVELF